MPEPIVFIAAALLGANLLLGSGILLRLIGADARTGRRLRWAREVRVGGLQDLAAPPNQALRVTGRIRCQDPLLSDDGSRLVAYHRDIEVELPGGRWRTIERLRETRSFQLWDHDGSQTVDPAQAAEPLVTIPAVWRGTADQLDEPHRTAAARLAPEGTLLRARSVTRSINVTDRLLVLALALRSESGEIRLEPPTGGYLISTLAIDDAMRLLGGRHRSLLRVAAVAVPVGAVLMVSGLLLAAVAALLQA